MPSTTRETPIAADYVIARMATFPLNSLTGFRDAATEIGPIKTHRSTARLWKSALRRMTSGIPGTRIDEFDSLRDRLWFEHLDGDDKQQLSRDRRDQVRVQPLHRFLDHLVRRNLRVDGVVARPILGPARRELDMTGGLQSRLARTHYLWLSQLIPPDLLVSVLPGVQRIEPLSPLLNRMLADQGFAETHLHLGAAVKFQWLWIAVLNAITEPDCPVHAFEAADVEIDPGYGASSESTFHQKPRGRIAASWLVRAAIARFLMAWYLAKRGTDPQVLSPENEPPLQRKHKSQETGEQSADGDSAAEDVADAERHETTGDKGARDDLQDS